MFHEYFNDFKTRSRDAFRCTSEKFPYSSLFYLDGPNLSFETKKRILNKKLIFSTMRLLFLFSFQWSGSVAKTAPAAISLTAPHRTPSVITVVVIGNSMVRT